MNPRHHLLPQHVTLVRRQGLQRIGDIGGGQAVDQPGELAGQIRRVASCPCGSTNCRVRGIISQQGVRNAICLVHAVWRCSWGEGHEAGIP